MDLLMFIIAMLLGMVIGIPSGIWIYYMTINYGRPYRLTPPWEAP